MRAYLERVWGDAAPGSGSSPRTPTRATAVIEPIRLTFDVACPADHAFDGLDRADRRLVAGRPHRLGERRPRRSCSRAGRWPHLRADARRDRARLGRGHGLGAPDPARLPVAPATRPRRRDRRGDPLRRSRRRRPPASRSSTRGWERLGAEAETWRDRNRRRLVDAAPPLHRGGRHLIGGPAARRFRDASRLAAQDRRCASHPADLSTGGYRERARITALAGRSTHRVDRMTAQGPGSRRLGGSGGR